MKKTVKIALALLMATIWAFPQAKAEFRWGPTAGAVFSNLHFKQDLMKIDGATGPAVGVLGEMMFPGLGFGVDISALYSMQGATMHLGDRYIWAVDGMGTRRSYLHTLSIPVDLRFKWTRMNGLEDYIAPFVFGGPVFDFHVAHNKIEAMKYAIGSVGIQAGLGVELKKQWQIQASYVWGMTYAMKAVKLIDYSAKSSYWNLRVAYLF
ncbi:MAG: PorT family protein [Muribaculaceae bacterium]|nr:PorT family protein [Muribaculaceae bacterium]